MTVLTLTGGGNNEASNSKDLPPKQSSRPGARLFASTSGGFISLDPADQVQN
jgi:hypothetical protein